MQYPTGSLVGLIVRFSEKEVVELEDELFWYAVLPPILLVQVRWYVYGSTMSHAVLYVGDGLLSCTPFLMASTLCTCTSTGLQAPEQDVLPAAPLHAGLRRRRHSGQSA